MVSNPFNVHPMDAPVAPLRAQRACKGSMAYRKEAINAEHNARRNVRGSHWETTDYDATHYLSDESGQHRFDPPSFYT